jgi:hypothetical protein
MFKKFRILGEKLILGIIGLSLILSPTLSFAQEGKQYQAGIGYQESKTINNLDFNSLISQVELLIKNINVNKIIKDVKAENPQAGIYLDNLKDSEKYFNSLSPIAFIDKELDSIENIFNMIDLNKIGFSQSSIDFINQYKPILFQNLRKIIDELINKVNPSDLNGTMKELFYKAFNDIKVSDLFKVNINNLNKDKINKIKNIFNEFTNSHKIELQQFENWVAVNQYALISIAYDVQKIIDNKKLEIEKEIKQINELKLSKINDKAFIDKVINQSVSYSSLGLEKNPNQILDALSLANNVIQLITKSLDYLIPGFQEYILPAIQHAPQILYSIFQGVISGIFGLVYTYINLMFNWENIFPINLSPFDGDGRIIDINFDIQHLVLSVIEGILIIFPLLLTLLALPIIAIPSLIIDFIAFLIPAIIGIIIVPIGLVIFIINFILLIIPLVCFIIAFGCGCLAALATPTMIATVIGSFIIIPIDAVLLAACFLFGGISLFFGLLMIIGLGASIIGSLTPIILPLFLILIEIFIILIASSLILLTAGLPYTIVKFFVDFTSGGWKDKSAPSKAKEPEPSKNKPEPSKNKPANPQPSQNLVNGQFYYYNGNYYYYYNGQLYLYQPQATGYGY